MYAFLRGLFSPLAGEWMNRSPFIQQIFLPVLVVSTRVMLILIYYVQTKTHTRTHNQKRRIVDQGVRIQLSELSQRITYLQTLRGPGNTATALALHRRGYFPHRPTRPTPTAIALIHIIAVEPQQNRSFF